MDTLQTESTPEEHTSIITDIRFRPNSTQLATSSIDRTVKLWNAAEVTIPNSLLMDFFFFRSFLNSILIHACGKLEHRHTYTSEIKTFCNVFVSKFGEGHWFPNPFKSFTM